MASILDHIEEGPLLFEKLSSTAMPKAISKTTIQQCISKLSQHWTNQQYEAVVEMFEIHELL